jgi:hypothetical protein
MSTVLAAATLVNGLRNEFADTYQAVQKRQQNSMLSLLMDDLSATNRYHDFAYFEAGPHAELWRRGESIPTDGFASVSFRATVHNFARRVKWHENDRADDQTQSLTDQARSAGRSWGLLAERMFFDLLTASTNTLPAVPNAPDGAAFFATTAGGAARFGATNGNLLSGSGVASESAILTDYYSMLEQFKSFQDGKGQPLLDNDVTDGELLIIHAAADLQAFEQAFLQKRQGIVKGTDAGTTPTNIVQDASRKVKLWGTQRLATGDWYGFLLNAPKKPTFMLTRKALTEQTSFEGDNNSDHTRDTGEEYIQWQSRHGAGIALPYCACKINN